MTDKINVPPKDPKAPEGSGVCDTDSKAATKQDSAPDKK